MFQPFAQHGEDPLAGEGDSRVDPDNRALLRVSLPLLPPGRYKVAWRVLSVDSHVTEGDFTFRIVP